MARLLALLALLALGASLAAPGAAAHVEAGVTVCVSIIPLGCQTHCVVVPVEAHVHGACPFIVING